MQTHIFPDDDEALYVLLKERIERLYSFGNGVARIRLCKCWQLICVQLLGNQKYNGSSLFCISYMKIYCVSASLFKKLCFMMQYHLNLLQPQLWKYLPILEAKQDDSRIFPPPGKLKPHLAGLFCLLIVIRINCQIFPNFKLLDF